MHDTDDVAEFEAWETDADSRMTGRPLAIPVVAKARGTSSMTLAS